jgi:hypothetical protein
LSFHRSLEFTDGFANQDGTPNADMPTTAARVRLSEQGGRTRMRSAAQMDVLLATDE